jgi:hypothetical protein
MAGMVSCILLSAHHPSCFAVLLLLLLLRGFPGWVTSDPSHPLTNATADYTIRWLIAAREHHNLTIDYIGIWNERYNT